MGTDLHGILEAREKRFERQRQLLGLVRRCMGSLVCFTLNTPGAEKQSPHLRRAHETGFQMLCTSFASERILQAVVHHEETGDEAYLCLDYDSSLVKQTTVALENTHCLGRLFDIDVFDWEGDGISRDTLGLPPRRCFLCETEAKICIRNRAHTMDELRTTVASMLERV